MKRRYGANPRFLLIAFCFFFSTSTLHNEMISFSDQYDDMPPIDPNVRARTPKPQSTMVHYDPYFMGGFRNQHMRFVAFVSAAVGNNISQILLPSLRWGDHYNKSKSIHHELLFDVDYWNSRAESLGLPMLVDYDPNVLEGIVRTTGMNESSKVIPCWNETTGLFSTLDEKILRNPATNLRRYPTWNYIGDREPFSHCRRTFGTGENNPAEIEEAARRDNNSTNSTNKVYRFTHLIPHGGLKSSGRLWWDYLALQSHRGKASVPTILNDEFVHIHPEHVPVEKAIFKLLHPSVHLQLATENAIATAVKSNVTRPPRLLALHPRVEQEMLTHRCSNFMEKNLTRVFELMQSFPSFFESNTSQSRRFDLVFVAVSKKEIEKTSTRSGELGAIMNGNRDALNDAREHGLFRSFSGDSNSTVPIFESGTDSAAKIRFPRIQSSTVRFVVGNRQRVYAETVPKRNASEESPFVSALDIGVLELVASIINFFIAVKADIFVGVKGSTYSTDVFSVRYYQHKEEGGGENYIVAQDGIERLYGPAAPHKCM